MKTKKELYPTVKTYRDLSFAMVEQYADDNGLNIEGEENYREAAIALFDKLKKRDNKTNVVSQQEKIFPNGVKSWIETHHETVGFITQYNEDPNNNSENSLINKRLNEQGIGGLYELAEELADEFERLNNGREWDGEFYDEIEEFLIQKNLKP